MKITIVAVLCHTLGSISEPVCREEIVFQDDMPLNVCLLSQPALADWKAHSIYRSDSWNIAKVKCIPGDYVLKDAI